MNFEPALETAVYRARLNALEPLVADLQRVMRVYDGAVFRDFGARIEYSGRAGAELNAVLAAARRLVALDS